MCECLDDYNGVVGSNPTHGASRGSSVRKCWHQHFHWIEQKRHTKFLSRINLLSYLPFYSKPFANVPGASTFKYILLPTPSV